MKSITITLPLPPRALNPNSRPHYMTKAAKTKKYRTDAGFAALHASSRRTEETLCPWSRATIQVRWFHRTASFPDPDNVIAWLKAAFDGIADAGVIANDRDVEYPPVIIEKDSDDPRVEIEVTESK